MKQVLLGTTALLAAGVLSGQAMAQASKADPIKLQLGGYAAFAGGDVVRQNDGPGTAGFNKRTFQFKENFVLGGLGETKLDNGLVVGAVIQLRGQPVDRNVNNNIDGNSGGNRSGALGFTNTDQTFQSYGYFKGEFGNLLFGDIRDAIAQKAYQAPTAGQLFGQNTPFFAFTNNPLGTNSTINDLGGNRATNLSYFSPSIAGFSFGTTFKPISGKGVYGGSNCAGSSNAAGSTDAYIGQNVGCTAFNNTLNGLADIVALHINYDAKFGDFTLGVGGGASHATKEKGIRAGAAFINGQSFGVNNSAVGLVNSDGDRNDYTASFNVIYGPFAIGGAWERQQNLFFNGANSDIFDIGGRYTIGPAQFSLGATRGYYKGYLANVAGLSNASGVRPATYNPTATPTLTTLAAVANYQLGPGIALSGALEYDIYHSHSNSQAAQATLVQARNYESIAITAGTRFNF